MYSLHVCQLLLLIITSFGQVYCRQDDFGPSGHTGKLLHARPASLQRRTDEAARKQAEDDRYWLGDPYEGYFHPLKSGLPGRTESSLIHKHLTMNTEQFETSLRVLRSHPGTAHFYHSQGRIPHPDSPDIPINRVQKWEDGSVDEIFGGKKEQLRRIALVQFGIKHGMKYGRPIQEPARGRRRGRMTPQSLADTRRRSEQQVPPSVQMKGEIFFHPTAHGIPESHLTHENARRLKLESQLPGARKELQDHPGHAHFFLDRPNQRGDMELSRVQKYPDGSISEHRGLSQQEWHRVNDVPPANRPEYFKALEKKLDPPLTPPLQQHGQREQQQNEWLPSQARKYTGRGKQPQGQQRQGKQGGSNEHEGQQGGSYEHEGQQGGSKEHEGEQGGS